MKRMTFLWTEIGWSTGDFSTPRSLSKILRSSKKNTKVKDSPKHCYCLYNWHFASVIILLSRLAIEHC